MAVDRLVEREARTAPCRTHEVPLGQAIDAAGLPRVEGVPEEAYERLAGRYGHAAHEVLAVARESGELAQPIVPGGPADLLAETVYAARREQAVTRGRRAAAPHPHRPARRARASPTPRARPHGAWRRRWAPSWDGTSAGAGPRPGLPRRGPRRRHRHRAVTFSALAGCIPATGPVDLLGARPSPCPAASPSSPRSRRSSCPPRPAPPRPRVLRGQAGRRPERGHPVARRPRRRARRHGRAGLRQARGRDRPRLRLAAGQRQLPGARAGRRRPGRRRLAAGRRRVGQRPARRGLRQRRRRVRHGAPRRAPGFAPLQQVATPARTPTSRCRSTASPT